MNRAVQARVDEPDGLMLMNFIVNLMGGASFHSASPIVPSIAGAAVQEADAMVFGSSGCWTRSRLISRVRFMKETTTPDAGRFHWEDAFGRVAPRVIDVGCGT